jgi:hypothetical protein
MADVDVFAGVAGGLTPVALAELLRTIRQPGQVVPARPARYEVSRYTVAAGGESPGAVAARNGISLADLLALNPGLSVADTVPAGSTVVVFRGVRPAQLVTLSPAVPDTLILKEARP